MKIYRLTQRIPQNYLDIGHHGWDAPPDNQQCWTLYNDDILTGVEYQGHGDFGGKSGSIGGRIDHLNKRISIFNEYYRGDDTLDDKVQYVTRLLKMDYPGYRVYYCSSGRTPKRIAQTRSNYYDVGHDSSDSTVWALKDNGDIVYGHSKDGINDHAGLKSRYPGLNTYIAGRIDHVSRKISVSWASRVDIAQVKHTESILQMDYPGYRIIERPPRFGKSKQKHRLAQYVPKTYYDIGHDVDSNATLWALRENGDIAYLDLDQHTADHGDLAHDFKDALLGISGRIDHDSKKISVAWGSRCDLEKVKYAISILKMDYTGYRIIEIPPRFGKRIGYMKMSQEMVTLRNFFDEFADHDVIWDKITPSDLDVPLPIYDLPVERMKELLSYTSGITIAESFAACDDEERREIVREYMKGIPENDIVVLEGIYVIDGHHRIAAALQTGYNLRYVDLMDLPR